VVSRGGGRGRRLYELAREGVSVPRKPRQVQIHAINIMAIWHEQETLGFGTRVPAAGCLLQGNLHPHL